MREEKGSVHQEEKRKEGKHASIGGGGMKLTIHREGGKRKHASVEEGKMNQEASAERRRKCINRETKKRKLYHLTDEKLSIWITKEKNGMSQSRGRGKET